MSESTPLTVTASPAATAAVLQGLGSATYSFRFVRQRWQAGILNLLAALAVGASGIFLLSEIPKTPALRVQMAILGALLSIAGVVLLANAFRDFFGRLTLDQRGVHVSPFYAGFSIRWDRLERWEILDSVAQHTSLPTVRFWPAGCRAAYAVPAAFLTESDQQELAHLLRLGLAR